MKILVGVDTVGHYQSALNLARRLKFSGPRWILAHSVDAALPITGFGTGMELAYGVEYAKLANDAATDAIIAARKDAMAKGLVVEDILLAGNPARALTYYADEHGVDLVAVHSEQKGRVGSLFLGSVSKGLALGCPHSILLAKGEIAQEGPIIGVFATDHSEYANEALQTLIDLKPEGIKCIHVITALHMGFGSAPEHRDLSKHVPTLMDELKEETKRKTDEAVAKLRVAGFEASGEVIDAATDDAIRDAITLHKADLLIMGAHGHGFWHRLTLGSTSLHQAIAEPWSVMLIRQPELAPEANAVDTVVPLQNPLPTH